MGSLVGSRFRRGVGELSRGVVDSSWFWVVRSFDIWGGGRS